MICNKQSFVVNYKKLFQPEPEPSLVIALAVLGDNQADNQQDCSFCACSITGQIKTVPAPDFDASELRESIGERCENDNQWPYNQCVGIYYESLLKTDFGNYLRVSVVHVKEETRVAQCIIEATDDKFSAIVEQTGLKTDGTAREAN